MTSQAWNTVSNIYTTRIMSGVGTPNFTQPYTGTTYSSLSISSISNSTLGYATGYTGVVYFIFTI
jgi:hypothetical protein